MLDIHNLTKKYGGTRVLQDISFQLKDGEILGFLGPNGAGKTTTMRILTGFLAPTGGRILMNGLDTLEDSVRTKRGLGYLPENNPLYTEMRVFEALRFTGLAKGVANLDQEIRRVVSACKLADVFVRPIHELSKGYKQRVGLAQALIGDPQVLVLDEPTSGLDPNQSEEVRKLIKNIGQKKSVLFSTHILREATDLCDRVIIIHKGAIVAQGTPAELLESRAGQQTLHVICTGPTEEILTALRQLPGVLNLEHSVHNEELSITLTSDKTNDLRRSVFTLARDHSGWIILEMQRTSRNLESLFRELTQ